MINNLINKKIVILGFGKEGNSTYNYIRKYDKNIFLTIMDNNYKNIVIDDKNVSIENINYQKLKDYDLIIKTPGISFKEVDISSFKSKITSQLELFLENTKAFIIGVTGSKGKSTTSTLIYEILKNNNKKCILLGNIGIPIFDEIDEIKDDYYVVIEISSHMLQYVKKSPNISVITNFFPEHLDHYINLDEYYNAKLNIARYQNKEDFLIYTSDNKDLKNYIDKINNQNKIDVTFKNNKYSNIKANLKGEHNLKDILYALKVSEILNLDLNKSLDAIEKFKPLKHRMELVGTYNGIIFYNDSIATIPDATINAIKALDTVNTLIVGGKDRNIDYTDLINYINSCKIKNIIFLPSTGHKICDTINSVYNKFKVDNVEEAVDIAMKVTEKGKICLLSPAASSYGYYKNFEDRGNRYINAIKKYK